MSDVVNTPEISRSICVELPQEEEEQPRELKRLNTYLSSDCNLDLETRAPVDYNIPLIRASIYTSALSPGYIDLATGNNLEEYLYSKDSEKFINYQEDCPYETISITGSGLEEKPKEAPAYLDYGSPGVEYNDT